MDMIAVGWSGKLFQASLPERTQGKKSHCIRAYSRQTAIHLATCFSSVRTHFSPINAAREMFWRSLKCPWCGICAGLGRIHAHLGTGPVCQSQFHNKRYINEWYICKSKPIIWNHCFIFSIHLGYSPDNVPLQSIFVFVATTQIFLGLHVHYIQGRGLWGSGCIGGDSLAVKRDTYGSYPWQFLEIVLQLTMKRWWAKGPD